MKCTCDLCTKNRDYVKEEPPKDDLLKAARRKVNATEAMSAYWRSGEKDQAKLSALLVEEVLSDERLKEAVMAREAEIPPSGS